METLSQKEEINNFLEKMKQAIEKQYDANIQKPQPNNESEKPKNNGYLLPLILVGGLVLLVGIASLVIWRQRRKKTKKGKIK